MRIITAILVTFTANQAAALCAPSQETFLSCTFQNGRKVLDVCITPGDVTYWYGPAKGEAELALSVPIELVDYRPWGGAGTTVVETVTFHNNNVSYEVHGGISRNAVGDGITVSPPRGGITIFENGAVLASPSCDAGSVVFPWTVIMSN